MLIDLDVKPRFKGSNRIYAVKKCEPFVKNKMAKLVHRVRHFGVHKISGREPHFCVDYICGNSSAGGSDKFLFVPSLSSADVVCARCEEAAIQAGMPTSSEISGRHICIGGVKVYSMCCPDKECDHD